MKVNADEVFRGRISMKIRIVGVRKLRMRLFVAKVLIRLLRWVLGANVQVELPETWEA